MSGAQGALVPVAEGLFEVLPDGPRLIGSHCASCDTIYFPMALSCRNPLCAEKRIEPALLPERGSLLSFTSGHLSDILFVQGLDDSPIQMYSWPTFRQQLETCTDCQDRTFLELPGLGHQSLFNSVVAMQAFNDFIAQH